MNIKNILGAVVLSLLLVAMGCGFNSENSSVAEKKESVGVNIQIDKSDKVYEASMAYYCDGEHCGSKSVVNANQSVLSGTYYFEFVPADFPDGKIPEDLTFELFVNDAVSQNGVGAISRSAGSVDLGTVNYGDSFNLKLQGDFKEGFGLKTR